MGLETAASMDWEPLALTMRVAAVATVVALAGGTVLGFGLAQWRSPLKRWVNALVLLPLALPPTVLGYYLLVVIGRDGWIGRAWEALTGAPLVFTANAAVVAACASTVPIVARQLSAAFEETDPQVLEAARLDGAEGVALLARVLLPLVRGPMMAAAAIAFARAVGDFGATLMVAGNIPGRTQTASLAIYEMMGTGRDGEALVLVAIVSALSVLVLVLTSSSRGARP